MSDNTQESNPGHKIESLRSFQDITGEPRQIAGLYFYELLDCLVDVAFKVSADFRKRPQLYRDLGDPAIAPLLAELNAGYGTRANLLSASERNEIYAPLFGISDVHTTNGTGDFARLRHDLLRAASAFAETAQEHGLPMLQEAVRSALRPFKDYLLNLHGDSTRFSKEIALSHLTEKVAYPVFRNERISAIFSVTKLTDAEYPYAADPARDLLIEQIDMQLTWRTDVTQSYGKLTRERISNLQRTAIAGAEAIATIIDFGTAGVRDDLSDLITKCYVWGTALASLDGRSGGSRTAALQSAPAQRPAATANRAAALPPRPMPTVTTP